MTEVQRDEYQLLKSNLLQARKNGSIRSFIQQKRLIVDNKEYKIEDVFISSEVKKPQSEPPTSSIPNEPGQSEIREESETTLKGVVQR